MSTDLSLQIAYGRLLLRAGQTDEAIDGAGRRGVAGARTWPSRSCCSPRRAPRRAACSKRRRRWRRPPTSIRATTCRSASCTSGWAAGRRPPAPTARRCKACDRPAAICRLRYVAALLNVPGGVGASRAKESIVELLKATPDDTRLLYLLSTASRQLQDPAGAEAAARKILAIDPTSVAGLSALARTLSDQYQYTQVVELMTPFSKDLAARAKGRETEAAAALAQLGLAQQQLGEFDASIAVFTSATAAGARRQHVRRLPGAGADQRPALRSRDRGDRRSHHAVTRGRAPDPPALAGAGPRRPGVRGHRLPRRRDQVRIAQPAAGARAGRCLCRREALRRGDQGRAAGRDRVRRRRHVHDAPGQPLRGGRAGARRRARAAAR